MVNVKTKSDKHANDDEKRRQSIKERGKAKLNQSIIIKNALSNSTLSNSNKKIVFSDEENGDEGINNCNLVPGKKSLNGNQKPNLFDGSESENEDFEIKEKTQFKGKKGFELLNLQSTYGNDDRFKIDERFLEDEKDEKEENSEDPSDEKSRQLKILGSVLGTPAFEPDQEKKAKKRIYEMIRYDASKKEHEIYEIKTPSKAGLSSTPIKSSIKSKDHKKKLRTDNDNEDLPRPKVSKEKFYEVSSEIKNQFKAKQDGQFSLLQTYGVDKVEEIQDKIESNEDLESDREVNLNKKSIEIVNDQKDEEKIKKKNVIAKGIWKESFFFDENDDRFREALEFINKKNSVEAIKAAEDYDKTRRKLKEILRLHLKKQMHKKDPFKNKVGGMNKKQLANSKMYNKKKPFKKNPGGKI